MPRARSRIHPATDRHAMKLSRTNPLDDPGWDERWSRHPEATVFHSAAWARALTSTYGYTPVFITAGGPQSPSALLAAFEVDSLLTGRRGIAAPFADLCPIIARDDDTQLALIDAVLEHGRSRDWRYLECHGGAAPADVAPTFFGHRLPLDAGCPALHARLSPANRRALRTARHAGLRVELSQEDRALDEFYPLHMVTRRRHGVPPQPRRFFSALQSCLIERGLGFTVLARSGSRAVAGAVFLTFGRHAIFKFGASDPRHLDSRPNNLVLWTGIEHLATRGFAELHFGRSSPTNLGLRQFKRSWGAIEEPIHYHRYAMKHDAHRILHEVGASPRFGRLARLMPLPMLRLAGALLYRHIA